MTKNVVMKSYMIIVLVMFTLANLGITQEQSTFEPSHGSDKCINDIGHLINSSKVNQYTVHNLLTEFTSKFSFKGGETKLCNASLAKDSPGVQKFKAYFYSDRGISFDELKQIYNAGFKRLLTIKNKKDHHTISQTEICGKISTDDAIVTSALIDEAADWSDVTCEELQKSGFSCARSIEKNQYLFVLQKVDQSITQLNSIAASNITSIENSEFAKIANFLEVIPQIETRITDLQPQISDGLDISHTTVNNVDILNIHLSFTKGKTFPDGKDWTNFAKQFKSAIESFWKGSYEDQNQEMKSFIVTVDRGNENTPKIWKVGSIDSLYNANALGVTSRDDRYFGFLPSTVENSSSVWRHEFGHVLGFGESYGAWLEVKNGSCHLGLFNDVTNVMNNTAEESGKLAPILQPQQIKSIIETYRDGAILDDQKIYQLRDHIFKTYGEFVTKAQAADQKKSEEKH